MNLKLKTILAVILATVVLMGCRTRQEAAVIPMVDHSTQLDEYSPTTLIVMCDSAVGKEPLREAIRQSGASIIYDYNIICGMAIRKPDNMTLEQAIEHFEKVPGVVGVSRDRITRLTDPVRPRTEVM